MDSNVLSVFGRTACGKTAGDKGRYGGICIKSG